MFDVVSNAIDATPASSIFGIADVPSLPDGWSYMADIGIGETGLPWVRVDVVDDGGIATGFAIDYDAEGGPEGAHATVSRAAQAAYANAMSYAAASSYRGRHLAQSDTDG